MSFRLTGLGEELAGLTVRQLTIAPHPVVNRSIIPGCTRTTRVTLTEAHTEMEAQCVSE